VWSQLAFHNVMQSLVKLPTVGMEARARPITITFFKFITVTINFYTYIHTISYFMPLGWRGLLGPHSSVGHNKDLWRVIKSDAQGKLILFRYTFEKFYKQEYIRGCYSLSGSFWGGQARPSTLKGQCHEIFRVFFIKHLFLVPIGMLRTDFKFFWIFVELFVFVIDSPVMNTPGSRLESFRFGNFCKHKSHVPRELK
jgi:hypothetical protein